MPVLEVDINIGGVIPVPIVNVANGAQVIGENVVLFGWTLIETSGAAPATVTLKTGDTVAGYANLAQGVSDTKWFGSQGIWCKTGIQIGAVTGALSGTLYLAYVQP